MSDELRRHCLWFEAQKPALDYNRRELHGQGYLIKNGLYSFGVMESIEAFLAVYARRTHDMEIYEVMTGQSRLVFDIEHCGWKELDDPRTWLTTLVDVVRGSLVDSGIPEAFVTTFTLTNGSRRIDPRTYKTSFHLVFADIIFDTNETMRQFVIGRVKPRVLDREDLAHYTWWNKGRQKHAIDWSIYTTHRAMRIPMAHKGCHGRLEPWDLVRWCRIDLTVPEAYYRFMSKALVQGSSSDDVRMVIDSFFLSMGAQGT